VSAGCQKRFFEVIRNDEGKPFTPENLTKNVKHKKKLFGQMLFI
jgi:hypothetical protein